MTVVLGQGLDDIYQQSKEAAQKRTFFGGIFMLCGSLMSMFRSQTIIEHGIRSDNLVRGLLFITGVNVEESLPPYSICLKVSVIFKKP